MLNSVSFYKKPPDTLTGARKTVILKNYYFTATVWQGWKKQTYGIRLRLSAVVCFLDEMTTFYALYGRDSGTGEIVAVFVVKSLQNSESRHNERRSLEGVSICGFVSNPIKPQSR